MHKSRFAGIIIDCETDDLDAAARFWSHALGCDMLPTTLPEDEAYIKLDTGAAEYRDVFTGQHISDLATRPDLDLTDTLDDLARKHSARPRGRGFQIAF